MDIKAISEDLYEDLIGFDVRAELSTALALWYSHLDGLFPKAHQTIQVC